jgi:hypothetical protein
MLTYGVLDVNKQFNNPRSDLEKGKTTNEIAELNKIYDEKCTVGDTHA